jgi:hypothetical protein
MLSIPRMMDSLSALGLRVQMIEQRGRHLPQLSSNPAMDFSTFNAAEQAHMSKVIEKKQVRGVTMLL